MRDGCGRDAARPRRFLRDAFSSTPETPSRRASSAATSPRLTSRDANITIR